MVDALPRVMRGAAAVALAVGAGTVAVVTGPAGPAAAATCTAPNVKVMVDFRPHGGSNPTSTWPVGFQGNGSAGNLVSACVPFTSGMTGASLLASGGFTIAGTQHDGPYFVCRLNGLPAVSGNPGARPDEPCSLTPPASAYWSYWHADPGDTSWEYSQYGAFSYHSVPGSVEVWEYGQTDIGGTYGQPPFTPQSVMPAAAAAGATAPTAPNAGGAGSVVLGPQPTGAEPGAGSSDGAAAGGPGTGGSTGGGSGSTGSGPSNPSAAGSGSAGAPTSPEPTSSSASSPGASSGSTSTSAPSSGAPREVDIASIADPAGHSNAGTPWATLVTIAALVVVGLAVGAVTWRRKRASS